MLSLLLVLAGLALATITFWLVDTGWRSIRREWQGWRQRPHTFQVTERIDHSDTVFSFRLEPLGRRCRAFKAGQYLTVVGPKLPAGTYAERRYSIDHWERTPGYYGLTIKREAMGRVSTWLHDTVQPGTLLRCRLPQGEFVLPAASPNTTIVLVAAGVGITPLRAMLHELMASGHQGLINLFYTGRELCDLPFHDEFVRLATTWSNFHYAPHLTGEAAGWSGARGRIDAGALLNIDPGDALFFFCASHAMIEALSDNLEAIGISRARIHYELFASSAGRCGNFRLRVGDVDFSVEGYPNLLSAMETHAVPVPSDCRAGHCGLCRRELVSGQVEHGPGLACALRSEEFLPCIAVPTSDIIVAA